MVRCGHNPSLSGRRNGEIGPRGNFAEFYGMVTCPLWAKSEHHRSQTEHADSTAGRQKCDGGRDGNRQTKPAQVLCAVCHFRTSLTAKPLLNWGTRHVAVRAKYTTVACLRLEPRSTICALIEELTRVSRHRLGFDTATIRASNCRLQIHFFSSYGSLSAS